MIVSVFVLKSASFHAGMADQTLNLGTYDGTVSGVGVFPESGKPKGSRIATSQDVQTVWRRMQQDDLISSKLRAGVDDMIDGAPPWDDNALVASGAGFRHNLNFGEGEAMISEAATGYNDLIDQVDVMIRPELPDTVGDSVSRVEMEDIIADCFSTMIRDWDEFHFRWQLLSRKFITHGVSIGYFCDEYDWKFHAGGWDNMWMPRQTEATEQKVDILMTQKDYLPGELYDYIRDEKTARELGWNPEVAKMALVAATRRGGKKLDSLWGPDWQALQKRLKNNDILTTYEHNFNVETIHTWVREYDGTYSHYISLKWPLTAHEDFLYKRVSRYPSATNVFTIFTFDVGNGLYHGIRGYGYKIFPFVQHSNRARNEALDSMSISSKFVLQPKDSNAGEESPITINGPFLCVNPEWDVVEHTFPNLAENILPVLHDFANQMDTNVPIYRSRVTRADNRPATKFEQQAKIETDSSLSGSSVNMFYRAWRRLLREMFRRVQQIIANDMLNFYSEVATFVQECEERGVPRGIILAVRRVTEERSVGNGSPQQRLNAFDQGFQMIGALDETGRKAMIRSKLVALFGPRRADEFMPADQHQRPVIDEDIAELENDAMMNGTEKSVKDGQNHAVHAAIHFGQSVDQQVQDNKPSIAEAIQKLEDWRNNGEQGSIEALTPQINFLTIALPHTEQHVQAMSADDTRRQQAGAARKALQEYAAMWMTYMRQLKKTVDERQQQEAQQTQPQQVDPLTAAKIDTEKAQLQMALQKFQQEQTMKVAEVQQRMELAQRQADAKMAEEIRKGTVQRVNETLQPSFLDREAPSASESDILTNARYHA